MDDKDRAALSTLLHVRIGMQHVLKNLWSDPKLAYDAQSILNQVQALREAVQARASADVQT